MPNEQSVKVIVQTLMDLSPGLRGKVIAEVIHRNEGNSQFGEAYEEHWDSLRRNAEDDSDDYHKDM